MIIFESIFLFENGWLTKIRTKIAKNAAKIAPRESVRYNENNKIQSVIFSNFEAFLPKILWVNKTIGAKSILPKNCGSIAKTLGRTNPNPCALHPAHNPQSVQAP